jgi:DNA-binding transcriptional regulator YdaS (Cro superfamily)
MESNMAKKALNGKKTARQPQAVGDVVTMLGGAQTVADMLGLSRPAIRFWKRVPAHYVLALEGAGKGKLSRYRMRPDIYGPAPRR